MNVRPEIIVLDPAQASALSAMTFPAYRHLLNLQPQCRHLIEPDLRVIQPVVLAAIAFGQPVAMALLELPADAHSRPEILYYSSPSSRADTVSRPIYWRRSSNIYFAVGIANF